MAFLLAGDSPSGSRGFINIDKIISVTLQPGRTGHLKLTDGRKISVSWDTADELLRYKNQHDREIFFQVASRGGILCFINLNHLLTADHETNCEVLINMDNGDSFVVEPEIADSFLDQILANPGFVT